MWIVKDQNGAVTSFANFKFCYDAIETPFTYKIGYDGKCYKESECPEPPEISQPKPELQTVTINLRGAYDPDEVYNKYDVVTCSDNGVYMCLGNDISNITPSTDPEFWSIFVLHGTQGQSGS